MLLSQNYDLLSARAKVTNNLGCGCNLVAIRVTEICVDRLGRSCAPSCRPCAAVAIRKPFHVTGLPPAYADGRIKGRNERPLAIVAFQWIMKHFPKVRGSPHNVRQPRFPWSLSTFRNMRAACLRPQACNSTGSSLMTEICARVVYRLRRQGIAPQTAPLGIRAQGTNAVVYLAPIMSQNRSAGPRMISKLAGLPTVRREF